MVKLDHAVGNHEWVMIRKAGYAGAQPNVAGPFSGSGQEQFGRRNGLPSCAVVFADIGFIKAQDIQPL
jgi:hypothetical protein